MERYEKSMKQQSLLIAEMKRRQTRQNMEDYLSEYQELCRGSKGASTRGSGSMARIKRACKEQADKHSKDHESIRRHRVINTYAQKRSTMLSLIVDDAGSNERGSIMVDYNEFDHILQHANDKYGDQSLLVKEMLNNMKKERKKKI
jgi:Ribonuclease G/E